MILPDKIAAIIKSDNQMGICTALESNIFKPTKAKIKAMPYFKYSNLLAIPASKKYKERSPIIAKILDV